MYLIDICVWVSQPAESCPFVSCNIYKYVECMHVPYDNMYDVILMASSRVFLGSEVSLSKNCVYNSLDAEETFSDGQMDTK